MSEQPETAERHDFSWHPLGILLLACLALLVWTVASTRPVPGILRSPPLPAKPQPKPRANPSGDLEHVCRNAPAAPSRLTPS